MRRFLRYVATTPSPCRNYIHTTRQQPGRSITTTPLNRWMDDNNTVPPGNQNIAATAAAQQDRRTTSGVLSQFYRLLASRNIDQLWPLYSTMYQNNLHTRLTRNNYRQLVQVAARSPKTQRNLHRLLALMEDMQQLAIPLRLSDYNIIMSWVGGATVPEKRPRHVSDALGWLTTMEKQHQPIIEPNVVTYNTLIHVASQANDILTAQRLYHSMLAKGIEADAYTYTTLLHSMATMGDVQGVQDMITRLERKGLDQLLNSTVAWNILLDCYYTSSPLLAAATLDDNGHGGDGDDGEDDDNDDMVMGNNQQQQRSVSYQSKANDMFQAMIHSLEHQDQPQSNVPMADPITFQIHIDHLLRHHQRDDALRMLLDTILQQHRERIQPTISMYNKLFASFVKKKDHTSEASSPPPPPTTTTTNDELSQLRQLYKSLQEQPHLQPTSDTLDTLIHALLDYQDTTFALEAFVHLCQEKNITPCQELLDRLSTIVQQDQDASLPPPSSPSPSSSSPTLISSSID